jgi:hypothetical protein
VVEEGGRRLVEGRKDGCGLKDAIRDEGWPKSKCTASALIWGLSWHYGNIEDAKR